ncbi:hypothetical protein STENM36S_09001 [Streptomyces tendae]
MARETTAAIATTVVTTDRSCGDRNIAEATASVPASIARTATAATTASDAVSERRRISRSTPAPHQAGGGGAREGGEGDEEGGVHGQSASRPAGSKR